MNLRKELLINEINENKNEFFVNILIRDYGYEALVELDDIFGYSILADKMANDNKMSYTICDRITHLAELRTLFKVIVDKFTYGYEEYKVGICHFVKIIRKTSYDTKKRWEEKLSFISMLVKEEINKAKENEEYYSFIEKIIHSIIVNPFLTLDDLKELSLLIGKDYKEVISSIMEQKVSKVFDSQNGRVTINIQNIIIELKEIYLILEELNIDYEFGLKVENIVREGLRTAMEETWFIVNIYPVFLSLNEVVDLYLDLDGKYYKIFFEILYQYILADEYEMLMEQIENYKEVNGEIPYESILREVEDNTLPGLIYTIHYSNELKDYPLYYFYWEIHKKMDAIIDIMNRLITHDILPSYIVDDPKKILETIKYDNLVINDVEAEFEISNFLNDLDLDDLDDYEE